MKPLQKINCVRAIVKNIKERGFSWDDAFSYLREYDREINYYENDNWRDIDEYLVFYISRLDSSTVALMYEELLGKSIEDVSDSEEVTDLWRSGYYRVFISHLTTNKVAAANLKKLLAVYGIDCFVAHEDIEPTKEWLKEIRKALNSADMLCAVFAPGFCNSKWCDQEVGFALGRRIPTIAISKGADPHGFLSEYQAIKAKEKAIDVANDFFAALCTMPESRDKYFKVLSKLFIESGNKEDALKWIDVILDAKNFPDLEVETIYNKYSSNEVLLSNEVVVKMNVLFKRIRRKVQKSLNNWPQSEDLPF